ncbi:MAG TPA: tail fiber domain-containing protein, partial [Candidatus Angelobacter sp.]|nr:tail fiber domain-containing protein [Candidatus Angelobacter sp.]
SIPHQALPEDDAQAVWLIPVGYVRWLPGQTSIQAGSFQQRTAKDLPKSESSRQYIGVVAGTVEAAGQNVQVKQRGTQPSGVASDDLLWVEGKMRIEGDLRLFDGKLSFLNSAGQDEGVPLLLQRTKQTDPITSQILTSLQIEIGSDKAGNNMLSVGPLDKNSKKFVPVFNVLDSGKIGMGTTAPTGRLTLNGIVQPAQGNLTLFSQTADIEYDGGNDQLFIFNALGSAVTSFLGGNLGVGTTTPTGRMTLAGIVQPQQGNLTFFSQSADIEYDGGNDHLFIFNASGNAVTSFLGGNLGVGTTAPTGRMTLGGIVQPQQGNLTFFSQTADIEYDGGSDHLFVFNATGNAVTSFLGGNIGIGTAGPSNRLHVADATGIRQNRLYVSGDAGWSSLTYNAYHDVNNAAWIFPDPTRPAATIEMDDNGGATRFAVFTTTSAAKTTWFERFHIDGETGAATINGSLTVNGVITATQVPFFVASDLRLKTNVEPLRDALGKLLQLRGVSFEWKDPVKMGGAAGPQLGMIAQEVEKVFPHWVIDGPQGYKVLGAPGFEALVIEAMRELKAQLDSLSTQKGAHRKTNKE